MRLLFLTVLLISASLLSAVDLRPETATIHLKDGKATEYAVFNNNVDKILIGKSLEDRQPASNVDWERVARIEYADSWRDRDYLRGLSSYNKKDFAGAVEGFTKTLDGKSEKLQIESHLGLARAHAQLKDYAAAISALQGIIQKFPRHRENMDVLMQIGKMHIAAGNAAEAAATADKMEAMKEYKPANTANAALLRASIAKSSGKSADAIATIKTALTKVSGAEAPDAVSTLTRDILELYLADKKYDEAIALGMKNRWWPNSDADVAAAISLSIAKAHLAKGEFEAAFRFAALAATAPGVSGPFSGDAKDVAKEAVSGIKQANEDNDDINKKYRKALGKL